MNSDASMKIQTQSDHYVNAGGIKTRYWSLGNDGPAIILIHGLGASAEIWMHNVAALAKDHKVFVPDLPGFGYSEQPPPSFSPFNFASFINNFMEALNILKAYIIGQSLGGGIALQFALQFPQKAEKLVLVDCAGFGKEVRWTLKLLSLPWIGELVSQPTRLGVALFFKYAVHDSAVITKEFIDIYYKIFTQPGFQQFLLRTTRSILNIHGAKEEALAPIIENLHRIMQPALIVWGANDQVLPIQQAYLGKEKMPHAQLHIMERCGHIPSLERPEEFNGAVLKFLGS
jgi:4,5:9,10-diseco-3-hydroxy-5,9,17-trioxoandrosta-1(10),2-diene-4-oate hydrolase